MAKKIENVEQEQAEPAVAEVAATAAPRSEDEALEMQMAQEEDRLPFPNARVVALVRQELDKEKIIRARVKKELNEFLGRIVRNVAKEMNKSPYTVIEAGDLHRAIKKYEKMEEISTQKQRLLGYMDRIKQDCNVLIGDVERSFDLDEGIKAFNSPKPEQKPAEQHVENQ